MSSTQSEIFSERLRTARERRGLTQAELGEDSGIPVSAISHFEAGRRSPSFDNLKKLADALEVTTDFLIGRVADTNAVGSVLFRDAGNLTKEQLDFVGEIVSVMIKKNKAKDHDE